MKKENYVLIAFIIVAFLLAGFIGYEKFTKVKMLKQKCDEIEKSPDLLYDCDCFPTVKKINESDYVESKTENFCTCICNIGGKEYAIEVRIAKNETNA